MWVIVKKGKGEGEGRSRNMRLVPYSKKMKPPPPSYNNGHGHVFYSVCLGLDPGVGVNKEEVADDGTVKEASWMDDN